MVLSNALEALKTHPIWMSLNSIQATREKATEPLPPSTNQPRDNAFTKVDGARDAEGGRFLKRAPTASPPGKKPRVHDRIVQENRLCQRSRGRGRQCCLK